MNIDGKQKQKLQEMTENRLFFAAKTPIMLSIQRRRAVCVQTELQDTMIVKKLKPKYFTIFAEQELEFGRGINVFIWENGTGKRYK